MRVLIEHCGYEGHAMTYSDLLVELDLMCSRQTLRVALNEIGIFRRKALQKPWISEAIAARRVAFAKYMLAEYPEPKD
jgi:hypothetical protein